MLATIPNILSRDREKMSPNIRVQINTMQETDVGHESMHLRRISP